jgi:uncharacterized Fe-S cluster-containing protein
MCDWEEFIFTCNHSEFRRKSYCHRARNHPTHACNSVKKLRDCWYQPNACEACELARQQEIAVTQAQAEYYASQGQGQGKYKQTTPGP